MTGIGRQALVGMVFLFSILVLSATLLEWYRSNRENGWIRQLLTGEDIHLSDRLAGKPEIRLARAIYLQKKGHTEDALATLSSILEQGGRQLQAKVRYNLGNIYLRQAITQVDAGLSDEAKTLITLAKQSFREALFRDSELGDAKYNLEVAMRLLPDFDPITLADEPTQQPKNPLWTTVPGLPRGLP